VVVDLPWREKRHVQHDLKRLPCRRVRSAPAQQRAWQPPAVIVPVDVSAPPVPLNAIRSPQVGWLEVDEAAAYPRARVIAGQLLATVRALGMEFRVEAPYAGILTDWHVTDGVAVGYGQLLATLEPG